MYSHIKRGKYFMDDLGKRFYEEGIRKGVHFSFKAVNSNAKAGGVRVATSQSRSLPYISMSTLISEELDFPLDYIANINKSATVFKHMEQVLYPVTVEEGKKPEKVVELSNEIKEVIKSEHSDASKLTFIKDDRIDPRLRQISIPNGNNDYVNLVPLPSSVFMRFIVDQYKIWMANKEEQSKKEKKQFRKVIRYYMGFGGANPQNAGRYLRNLQRGFVFDAPTEDPTVRHALSIHYKGIKLGLPADQMKTLRDLREKNRINGVVGLHKRNSEDFIVRAILFSVLARGRDAKNILKENIDALPKQQLVDDGLDSRITGLINHELRNMVWYDEFSALLAQKIAGYRFYENGKATDFAIPLSDVADISKTIKEALLK